MQFKLDTGAEVTAVSEETYRHIDSPGKLQKANKILYGPTRQSLKVLGQSHGRLQVKDCMYQALEALNLVQKVDTVYSSCEDVRK